jgi:hypothetical protein
MTEPVVVKDGGSGGIIAVLVVVVVLLVAGFLYFTRYGDVDDGPDIELNVPAPDANAPAPVTPPAGNRP